MSNTKEYTDLIVNIPDAFNAYMLQKCPFYSSYQYNSSSDIIVTLTEDINDARSQVLDSIVHAYVDPEVFYLFSYAKTALTPSETVVDGTDSGQFTPLTTMKAVNYYDGNLINTVIVTIHSAQIDGPSTSDAALTLKLKDLTNQTDMMTAQVSPSGVKGSDGGYLFDVSIDGLAQHMPANQADWELSVAINGNLAIKSTAIQFQYSFEETLSEN